jgi:hypothetical protein
LDDEITSAEAHFHSLLYYFRNHYIAVLDGDMIDSLYIVKRMLAEFAAATVTFSLAIEKCRGEGMDIDVDGLEGEEGEEGEIPISKVKAKIDGTIAESYPEVFHYYLTCVEAHHPHFTWTGPPLVILPRSEGGDLYVGVTSDGEQLDHPTHPIFMADPTLLHPLHNSSLSAGLAKRRGSTSDGNLQANKRRK